MLPGGYVATNACAGMIRRMRNDALARVLDSERLNVSPRAARDLFHMNEEAMDGGEVARRYGLLAHYTSVDRLPSIIRSGGIGSPGCWLSPTAYAACMTPYNLGLDSPRDLCLLVDVSGVSQLWGPGTSPSSGRHPSIWRGGGIEFFAPSPIPLDQVRHIVMAEPCGDGH